MLISTCIRVNEVSVILSELRPEPVSFALDLIPHERFEFADNFCVYRIVKDLDRTSHSRQRYEIGRRKFVASRHPLLFHKKHQLLDERIFFYTLQEFIEVVPAKLLEAYVLNLCKNLKFVLWVCPV